MDKKTIKHILNVLRRGTTTWYGRTEAMNKYAKYFPSGKFYRNGKEKLIKKYKCYCCENYFLPSQTEGDHVEEVGQFDGNFHSYVLRMYCDPDNIKPICTKCHKKKTSSFNVKLNFERKLNSLL